MGAAPVASPCTDVCRMDEATGWCEGCLRTLDEIARWSALGDEDKRAIRGQLERRREQWRPPGRVSSEGVDPA
ncbi:MAG: DUF1289 domain-containing protein [Rubrivivax sp.]|nr:DUF1289 domain-containing protein [Rubrivivax sp.]